jgi:hypothetical protein
LAFLGVGAAIATAIGASATGIIAGAIDFGVTIAASVGISYAAQALAAKPTSPSQTASSGFQVQSTINAGGAVARSFPLGLTNTAGSLVYANTWGTAGIAGDGNDLTPNAYLTQVIALSDLPGCTLQEFWVNGQLCSIESGSNNMGHPVQEFAKDGNDHLWIKYYDGTQTEVDSFLNTIVSSNDRPYTATRVGVGVAYAIVTSLVDDTLFSGIPTFKFTLSGIPLYDPTKDDTNGGSGSQRYSDPSTWGGDGDNLPSVHAYNVLRGIRYNGAWLYGLQATTAANLPTVNWNAQIDKCRATIQGASGLEPTYRAGGEISVSTQPADALDAIMTACQGKISEVGGTYKVQLGIPDAFSASFTDDDILSTEDQTFNPFLTLADSVNGITGTYPDPTQAWNSTTAPPLYNATFEAQDGSRRLLANTSFDLVPYAEQVQRLMSSALNAARRERTHTIVMPPPFWATEPGDTVRWNSVRNGYVDKDFVVTAVSDQANCDVALTLQEIDPSDYDWDTTHDFRPPNIGGTIYSRPSPQGVVAWFAEGTVINDSSGSPRRPAIALSWDGSLAGIVGVQWEVRLTSTGDVVTRDRTDQYSVGTALISQSLLPNTAYQARGQYLPSSPRDMLWSDWLDVTTPDVRFTLADFDDSVIAMVNAVQQFDDSQIQATLNTISSLLAQINARTWDDKRQLRSQLDATAGQALAEISDVRTVAVDTQTALADFTTTVNATFGPSFSTVSTVSDAVATLDGYAAASWSVTLDVNNFVTGIQLVNGGEGVDSFTVTTDKFQVAAPGVGGGDAKPIFTVANVNGVPQVALAADMFADGKITALALNVGELTAITEHLGSGTVDGTLTSIDGLGMAVSWSNANIIIADNT